MFDEHVADAQKGTTDMPKVMNFFTTVFGEYPYSKEKYGMTQLGFYSGIENIRVKCALFGMKSKEVEECLPAILEFSGIENFADAPFGSYSAGMRTRVNFAVSIFSNPDLLITSICV